jgi:hypothetical protein
MTLLSRRRRLPRPAEAETAAPQPSQDAQFRRDRRRFGLPNVEFPQPVARERRRRQLRTNYGADFDLVAEVREIVSPLAAQVSEVLAGPIVLRDTSVDGKPLALHAEVQAVATAVHELRNAVVELLARDKQISAQARARLSAAVGADPPYVTDEQLRSGAWVAALTGHVGPLAGDLAALLGRSAATATAGCVSSVSESLVEALRPLDSAALSLARRVPKLREHQERWAARPARDAERAAQRERERRARELQRLGLS